MIKTLTLLGLIISHYAKAQPMLDHPINLSLTDYCYQDAADIQVIDCMPKKLCRTGDVEYQILDGTWRAIFSVGVCVSEVGRLEKALKEKGIDKQIKFQRGVSSTFEFLHYMKLSERYESKVSALGDALDLVGPTLYVLEMNRSRRFFGLGRDRTPDVMDSFFYGNEPDYLGSINYTFVAKVSGESFFSKTVIPVFVSQ